MGTVFDFSALPGGTIKFTSGGTTVGTCTGSTIKGTIGNAGGATATASGNISELTFTGCNQTTDTVALGSLEVHYIEGTHNGTVVGKGFQVTLKLFGTTCTYGPGEGTDLGTLTGGTAPLLPISTTLTKMAGNLLCTGTIGWDAEYVLTEPHALFVTAG